MPRGRLRSGNAAISSKSVFFTTFPIELRGKYGTQITLSTQACFSSRVDKKRRNARTSNTESSNSVPSTPPPRSIPPRSIPPPRSILPPVPPLPPPAVLLFVIAPAPSPSSSSSSSPYGSTPTPGWVPSRRGVERGRLWPARWEEAAAAAAVFAPVFAPVAPAAREGSSWRNSRSWRVRKSSPASSKG